MKYNILVLILIACFSISLFGCKTQKSTQNHAVEMAVQPTIVYKTKKNYDKNVGILLSDDKKTIVSYPHPTDVSAQNYPISLKNGYLLDNRGIGRNVAFISLTYEEYATLKTAPSSAELLNMVIDNDPLKKMYYCGGRTNFSDILVELNQLIDKKFEGCHKLK